MYRRTTTLTLTLLVLLATSTANAGCSSGGAVPDAVIPAGPGFQVPFAERIRAEADIATGAVGLITEAGQAEEIIREDRADLVLMAREFLRRPQWALHAAQELGVEPALPRQYERGF